MSAAESSAHIPEIRREALPTVAIVGRPNVGKSALFNRLVGRRQAIVHESEGVTRDRVTSVANHEGKRFLAVDTGGLGVYKDETGVDLFNHLIREQLLVAVETADRVILVVDAQAGMMPLDQEVAALLREHNKSVILAANKADNQHLEEGVLNEFGRLGFRPMVPISCLHDTHIDRLLDFATEGFPAMPAGEAAEPLKVAIIGRPNVGKSSIVNYLLGEKRVIVSEVAGTTRDAIDVPLILQHEGKDLPVTLIDTAGIRARGKIRLAVEHFSVARSEAAIRRADVVVVVLDATSAGTGQDKKICQLVMDAGKACIMLANKWDLASQSMKQKELQEKIDDEMPFMTFARVMTCCATSGYNLKQLFPALLELSKQLDAKLPTSVVNKVLHDAMQRLPPQGTGHGTLKVYYALHEGNRPPKFILFVNRKKAAVANYLSYLENQIRRAFGMEGMPIAIELRERRADVGQGAPNRRSGKPGSPKTSGRTGGGSGHYSKRRSKD